MSTKNEPVPSDTPDGRPARAQRELDRQHGRPKGWNIPSRCGARLPVEEACVDGYNVSSLN